MKKLMFLVNPNAGKGGWRSSVGAVLEVFYSAGYLPEVYFTAGPGDATRLTRENAQRYELLVCMGGDGTLSEVASGLTGLPGAPELGYIPMGTANDVATCLHLSRDPVEAAETVATGKAMPMDIGCFNGGSCFTYVAAFGAFTDVSYQTPQQNKQALGHLAYVIEGVARLPKLAAAHAVVEYDGGVIEGDFIFGGVTNSTSLAGMIHLDEELVSLSDGELEPLLLRTPQNFVDLQAAFTEFLKKNYDGEQIKLLHTREVRFSFPQPVAWTRDGENGGEHSEVHLKNIHNAIRIRVSPDRC